MHNQNWTVKTIENNQHAFSHHMYPGETLYRDKNLNKQTSFIAKIMYDHLQNTHHEKSTLKELVNDSNMVVDYWETMLL